jgi:hypothetical protein
MDSVKVVAVDGGAEITWTLTDATAALHMMRHVRQTLIGAGVQNHVYLNDREVKAIVALTLVKATAASTFLASTFGA